MHALGQSERVSFDMSFRETGWDWSCLGLEALQMLGPEHPNSVDAVSTRALAVNYFTMRCKYFRSGLVNSTDDRCGLPHNISTA